MGWSISWEEFRLYIDDFLALSDEIGDGWAWKGNKDNPGGAFIMKQILQENASDIVPSQDNTTAFEDSSLNEQDDTIVRENERNCKQATYEYHVLYSLSYATPVLYFNAFTADGCLLSLESLWKGMGGTPNEALQQMRWDALSQQEHPILRRPYYQLHPCKTAEFLENHQSSSANPIVTWLSSMGPAVGLHLSIVYSSLVNKCSAR